MKNQMSLRSALALAILVMDYVIESNVSIRCEELKQAREIIYQMLEKERKDESNVE